MKHPVGITVWACLLGLSGIVLAAEQNAPQVLATFDQQTITLEEFAEYHPELVSWFGLGAKAPQVQTVLEGMIFNQLLAREARQHGIAEQSQVRFQIDRILATAYLQSRLPEERLAVDAAEVRRYYETHQEDFLLPPQFQISHILVRSEQDALDVQQALAAGGSFAQLAIQRSSDPASAGRGGKLGWVTPEHLIPPLAETALGLQVGQWSGVVNTAFGYHLVLLEDQRPPAPQSFDSIKAQLYAKVRRQKQDALVDQVKQELWAKYGVVVHRENLLAAVQEPTGNAAIKSDVVVHHVSSPLQKSGPAPQLQVLSTHYDLGSIPAKPIIHTFLVANSGTADLVIRQVRTTCRCTTATVMPTTLAPGQIGKLTFTYDPNLSRDNGPKSHTIVVESNDSTRPRQIIHMTIDVTREGRMRDDS